MAEVKLDLLNSLMPSDGRMTRVDISRSRTGGDESFLSMFADTDVGRSTNQARREVSDTRRADAASRRDDRNHRGESDRAEAPERSDRQRRTEQRSSADASGERDSRATDSAEANQDQPHGTDETRSSEKQSGDSERGEHADRNMDDGDQDQSPDVAASAQENADQQEVTGARVAIPEVGVSIGDTQQDGDAPAAVGEEGSQLTTQMAGQQAKLGAKAEVQQNTVEQAEESAASGQQSDGEADALVGTNKSNATAQANSTTVPSASEAIAESKAEQHGDSEQHDRSGDDGEQNRREVPLNTLEAGAAERNTNARQSPHLVTAPDTPTVAQNHSPGGQGAEGGSRAAGSGGENHAINAATSKTNPSTISQSTANAAPAPDGADGVDRVRFVQRVARAFEAINGRNGTVRMKLHPPELGSLRVEIQVERGVMTARMEAESNAARNLILDNLPMLRDRLAQQDIKVQQFSVDLMDQSSGGLTEQQGGEQSSDESADGHRFGYRQRNAERDGDDRPANDRPRRHYSNSELDVLI